MQSHMDENDHYMSSLTPDHVVDAKVQKLLDVFVASGAGEGAVLPGHVPHDQAPAMTNVEETAMPSHMENATSFKKHVNLLCQPQSGEAIKIHGMVSSTPHTDGKEVLAWVDRSDMLWMLNDDVSSEGMSNTMTVIPTCILDTNVETDSESAGAPTINADNDAPSVDDSTASLDGWNDQVVRSVAMESVNLSEATEQVEPRMLSSSSSQADDKSTVYELPMRQCSIVNDDESTTTNRRTNERGKKKLDKVKVPTIVVGGVTPASVMSIAQYLELTEIGHVIVANSMNELVALCENDLSSDIDLVCCVVMGEMDLAVPMLMQLIALVGLCVILVGGDPADDAKTNAEALECMEHGAIYFARAPPVDTSELYAQMRRFLDTSPQKFIIRHKRGVSLSYMYKALHRQSNGVKQFIQATITPTKEATAPTRRGWFGTQGLEHLAKQLSARRHLLLASNRPQLKCRLAIDSVPRVDMPRVDACGRAIGDGITELKTSVAHVPKGRHGKRQSDEEDELPGCIDSIEDDTGHSATAGPTIPSHGDSHNTSVTTFIDQQAVDSNASECPRWPCDDASDDATQDEAMESSQDDVVGDGSSTASLSTQHSMGQGKFVFLGSEAERNSTLRSSSSSQRQLGETVELRVPTAAPPRKPSDESDAESTVYEIPMWSATDKASPIVAKRRKKKKPGEPRIATIIVGGITPESAIPIAQYLDLAEIGQVIVAKTREEVVGLCAADDGIGAIDLVCFVVMANLDLAVPLLHELMDLIGSCIILIGGNPDEAATSAKVARDCMDQGALYFAPAPPVDLIELHRKMVHFLTTSPQKYIMRHRHGMSLSMMYKTLSRKSDGVKKYFQTKIHPSSTTKPTTAATPTRQGPWLENSETKQLPLQYLTKQLSARRTLLLASNATKSPTMDALSSAIANCGLTDDPKIATSAKTTKRPARRVST
ncbi:Aste57867_11131 [Aphanomyces stellatus]|uniref:Aste57867_11131 protein n=1 Tax=Aphanomyces stellatus TaxID=120398 RepID=A0A485KS54_9STRA|nr:hypothetical protein As57867_011089 [Aphanomyces stellatus]VFT87998.1 Aste57867_11131 [Aphanomyces stellatus]